LLCIGSRRAAVPDPIDEPGLAMSVPIPVIH
jgi:hypothetical protein